jgi:hypothetical protein
MKKIKRLADIQEEKMRLRIRELELEKDIRNNWKELKTDLRPGTLLRNKLAEYTHKEEGKEESLLSGAIHFGTGYLSQKLAEKTEAKVQDGVETLLRKVKDMFSKKK